MIPKDVSQSQSFCGSVKIISYFNLPYMRNIRLAYLCLLYFRKISLCIFSLSFCAFHPCSTTVVCSFPVAGSEILVLAQRKTNHLPPATVEV